MRYLISSSHLNNNLYGFLHKESTITTHDQRTTVQRLTDCIEDGLYEVLRVVFLLKRRHRLAETRSTRFLMGEWSCWDGCAVVEHSQLTDL